MSNLSILETKEVLDQLRAVDLQSISLNELMGLYSKLSKHVAIVTTIPAGTVVCRTVSCNYLKGTANEIPTKVSQISFNPVAETCGYNRASWEGVTAFYGSVTSETLESYMTNGFEVIGDLLESKHDIDRETFVIGKWLVKRDLALVHVSGDLKHNALQAARRYDAFLKLVSVHPEQIIQFKMIDTFLTSEFSKKVDRATKWDYKLSAAYAEFVKTDGWPGILFPSIASEGAGYNVVLFPEFVDEYLDLERAVLTTYYKRSKSVTNEILMEATPYQEKLVWKDVYNHKLPPPMRKWYYGLTDDDSFNKYIKLDDL